MIIFRKNDNEHLFPKIIIMGIYVSLYFFLLTLWFLREEFDREVTKIQVFQKKLFDGVHKQLEPKYLVFIFIF